MGKVLVPSLGASSWQALLAEPERQWARGYSARTMAHAWESASGIPVEIDRLLTQELGPVELLLAIPEHKTSLPGGRRESQSDVFALVRHGKGLATCAIEGKVDEPFGPTVGQWLVDASPGKHDRLAYLGRVLGFSAPLPGTVRYQLVHRTAAALIEADRYFTSYAAMIVQSFSPTAMWFADFQAFVRLFGLEAQPNEAVAVTVAGKSLVLGWATGDQAFRGA